MVVNGVLDIVVNVVHRIVKEREGEIFVRVRVRIVGSWSVKVEIVGGRIRNVRKVGCDFVYEFLLHNVSIYLYFLVCARVTLGMIG